MIDVDRLPAATTALGQLIRLPLYLIPRKTVVRILQGPLKGKRWVVGSGIHRLWLGSYESAKMRLARDLTSPGDVVFDIGANGVYSLLFSDCVGHDGQVVAFEPSPRNVNFLRLHLRLNSVDNVLVQEVALSDVDGTARFGESDDPSIGRLDEYGGLEITTRSVDSVVAETGLVPQLLKIDVEGAELVVLLGASATLSRYQPRLLLATHSDEVKQACVDRLTAAGYVVHEIRTGGSVLEDELFALPATAGGAPTNLHHIN